MKQAGIILKYFGIIAGTIGILFGAFTFFDNMQDDIGDIKEMTDYNNVQINDVSSQLYNLQDTANNIQRVGIKNAKDIQTLKWGLQHFNDFDPDQFEDILEEMLKKNYSLSRSPSWIPPPQSTHLEIGSENITELTKEKLNSSQ